ncbi:MAG: hypothetical protein BGO23_05295 [Solirubrobacterales bacterium 67-14]|nr:MAG: hypothetical protein BGO23_05295 [Solirubrobacterales bacterium 67-14]
MVTSLKLHGRDVGTVFDLLGRKENDITYSFGWGLSQSDALARALLNDLTTDLKLGDIGELTQISLQNHIPETGYTDIEIETDHAHVIVEAKRGWIVPGEDQLSKYGLSMGREDQTGSRDRRKAGILIAAEGRQEFAKGKYPKFVKGSDGRRIPVAYRSWTDLVRFTENTMAQVRSTNEKRLLGELVQYLKGLMSSRSIRDNMVYVVPLSRKPSEDWTPIPPLDIVLKHGHYFHPVGHSFPKEPKNYLGFRFDAKLQQINFVEHVEVTQRPRDFIPGFTKKYDFDIPHYMYKLGPAIVPSHDVKSGKMWPGQKLEAALDLLLTCDTLKEARDRTNERFEVLGD